MPFNRAILPNLLPLRDPVLESQCFTHLRSWNGAAKNPDVGITKASLVDSDPHATLAVLGQSIMEYYAMDMLTRRWSWRSLIWRKVN